MSKTFSKIKQNAYQRRLAVSLAGIKSGSRYAAGGVSTLFKHGDEKKAARNALLAREAMRFVEEISRLKGAYVKIGQMLAIYGEHVLPPELVAALKTLNDQGSHVDWPVMSAAIEAELGERYADFDIEPKAIAAASLAQVYKATHIASGKTVALKIQYPGVATSIESDFRDIVRLMELAKFIARDSSTGGVLSEVHSLLAAETDYAREAQMTQKMTDLLAGDARYLIPAVHHNYTTPRLLVLDYVDGDKLDSPAVASLSQKQRNALAKSVLDLFFREVFDWRLMQTDPNFGNYMINITDNGPQLTLLDFGAVRELDADFADAFAFTIAAAAEGDIEETIDGLDKLQCFKENQSESAKESFALFCLKLVEPFRHDDPSTPSYAINAHGEYRWAHANLVRRAAKLAATSALSTDFAMPPKEFALITRKLSGVFSAMSALNAELNTRKLLQTHVQAWRDNSQ